MKRLEINGGGSGPALGKMAVAAADGRVLRRAADIVESHGLCQGWYARDADGGQVDETDPHAESFCIRGALHKAVVDLRSEGTPGHDRLIGDQEHNCLMLVRSFLLRKGVLISVVKYNDRPGRTAAEVAGLLRDVAAGAPPEREFSAFLVDDPEADEPAGGQPAREEELRETA